MCGKGAMKDIDEYVYKLAVLIDEISEGSGTVRTFKVDAAEKEWSALNTGIEFRKVLSKLMSQNKIGIVAKNTGEIRDADRTD